MTAFPRQPARMLPNRRSAAVATAPSLAFARRLRELLFVLLAATGLSGPVVAQEAALGADLQGLLSHARAQSPELRAMQAEADAASQRVGPAGALPDPVLRVELMNINNDGTDASPSLLPWKVGETKYTLMQSLPLWGKRELKRDAACADAQPGRRAQRRRLGRTVGAHQGHLRRVLPRRGQRAALERSARPDGAAGAGLAGPLRAVALPAQSDAIRAQLRADRACAPN